MGADRHGVRPAHRAVHAQQLGAAAGRDDKRGRLTALRLLLVRHPGTAVTRTPVVPLDEPAAAALPDLTRWLGRSGETMTSPARRCRVEGAAVEPELRAWDLGRWAGQPWEGLELASWRSDPAWAGHGGESLLAFHRRVAELLGRWHGRTGRLAAVTHGAVVKAAVVTALQAPADAVWKLDIAPGSRTELHATGAGWRVVRVNGG